MVFPQIRLRRLRLTETRRRLVREIRLSTDDLIYPIFVVWGRGQSQEISSMPGVYRWSVDLLPKEAEEVAKLNIPAVILFGIPEHKDEEGSEAYNPEGIVPQAIKVIKKEFPELIVIADVCLCEYTSHGHCGVVNEGVDNDRTLKLISRAALVYAQAGADIVAPSGMIDGQVKAIRGVLEEEGLTSTAVMAYSAKFASCFYGPFREAALSAPQFGDRRGYQMDPANLKEALREIEEDIAEGADIVMVKPALAYLDVISQARSRFLVPIAAYNVSGEYSMVKAAARFGWIDEKKAVLEILTAIKRAGADMILTYHAKGVAGWLTNKF